MRYAVGSLVKARGREWVVLPESRDDLLILRPLGGTDDEVAGVYVPLEPVQEATFDLPDPSKPGDFISCRLLRDAVRLGFRSSAGPFRSFARLGCDPRPYQLVPLLMALKLDPVRILVADDVGIGKTVEACLIARELMDRGEVQRLAVLSPPHLAEQWQAELRDKFHLECELVLPSTVSRLERRCSLDRGIFDVYPHVIVSMDFIKSDRHRDDFLRACPEMVIVDEAHTCAWGAAGRGGKHQRYELVRDLARSPERHMILVTATPHSGNDEAFRSLLGILSPELGALPEDLAGPEQEAARRKLAAHLVQRRRADIRHYLKSDTPFPDREEKEETYKLSPSYRKFFERVLAYARETASDASGSRVRQRVRWWSALALLRALASSPAAAAATLRNRAHQGEDITEEQVDEVGERTVLDLEPDETAESVDVTPGADPGGDDEPAESNRRRLLDMARAADALAGKGDEKLAAATKLLRQLIEEGFRPIVFCRFIPTAEYVAAELRKSLPRTEVAAVTGNLPPAEREERIAGLAERAAADGTTPVLVCTDCLSEGINLQEHFDAAFHYDLSWNPTRHEQRQGRVDRFGQPRPKVRVLTLWGVDTQIDGIVLEVLLRKHQAIRKRLGISVPIPVNTTAVVQALVEGLLLRGKPAQAGQGEFEFMKDVVEEKRRAIERDWESAADREKRSRTVFAQESIKVDEVSRELDAVRSAIGAGVEVERFVTDALRLHGASIVRNGCHDIDLRGAPRPMRDLMGVDERLKARFDPPADEGIVFLHRTHPVVEGVAGYVMDTALDPKLDGKARRSGAIRTRKVERRTTLLLLRLRYHIVTRRGGSESPLLAEDCQALAFEGPPSDPVWLPPERAEALIVAEPDGNVAQGQAEDFLRQVVDRFDAVRPRLEEAARERGERVLEAHRRVRTEAQVKGVTYRVEPKLPVDVLGVYVYLPAVGK